MKKLVLLLACTSIASVGVAQISFPKPNLPNIKLPDSFSSQKNDDVDISGGLKQALNQGLEKAVARVSKPDGFFFFFAIKVMLPSELKEVDTKMRSVGMGNTMDEGLKLLNRAAEDASAKATPIFTNAIKEMTFNDAKGILMGPNNAATEYMKRTTTAPLYQAFNPTVSQSLQKVGATVVWEQIITKYNGLPFVSRVNPDLSNYVTNKTIDGLFVMVAKEELAIRKDPINRASDLLKRVFALQDK